LVPLLKIESFILETSDVLSPLSPDLLTCGGIACFECGKCCGPLENDSRHGHNSADACLCPRFQFKEAAMFLD